MLEATEPAHGRFYSLKVEQKAFRVQAVSYQDMPSWEYHFHLELEEKQQQPPAIPCSCSTQNHGVKIHQANVIQFVERDFLFE